MLSGKMSNEDEDEVEDELEAMEKEAVSSLPEAPNGIQEDVPDVPVETPAERAKRRQRDRAGKQNVAAPIAA